MTIINKIQQQDGLIKSLQSKLSKLATEAEQLRKERDELVIGVIDIVLKTSDNGSKIYAGDAGEKAIEIASNYANRATTNKLN